MEVNNGLMEIMLKDLIFSTQHSGKKDYVAKKLFKRLGVIFIELF